MSRYLIPLILFVFVVLFLAAGLNLDPRKVPSPLIDKPAPAFTLPRLHEPGQSLGTEAMRGQVWLLNVWASWCAACRTEHPVLNKLVETRSLNLVGLNYKDEPAAAKQWLRELGNPYVVSLMDQDGRVGIDWGVYGVPETFVIDKQGVIRHKHIGPLTYADIGKEILPLIDKLEQEPE